MCDPPFAYNAVDAVHDSDSESRGRARAQQHKDADDEESDTSQETRLWSKVKKVGLITSTGPAIHTVAVRPHIVRRKTSSLELLVLDLEADRKYFGLERLQVSTSPLLDDDEYFDASEDMSSHMEETSRPLSASSDAMRSKNDSQSPIERHVSPPSIRTPSVGIVPSPAPRSHRPPAPPSPLSRLHPDPQPASVSPRPIGAAELEAQTSPCFIHSLLDRHGSLQDWLRNKSSANGDHPPHQSPQKHRHGHAQHGDLTPGPGRQHTVHHPHPQRPPHYAGNTKTPNQALISRDASSTALNGSGYESDRSSNSISGLQAQLENLVDDDEDVGSLTRQLAETAQGVREMSKQLGRTRVRSKIHHVLIVTKARDNRLIKLTRELALYLMLKTPANVDSKGNPIPESSSSSAKAGQRGMVVYVDAQLRDSKRFDAAGIERDYPQLAVPTTRRRSSSSASVNTMSGFSSTGSLGDLNHKRPEEGQLRYWTSKMCSESPQLFDFVVTLGGDGTVLFTSWLFQKIVPPVLPFALGSLGFLTNFDFANCKQTIDKVIDDGIRVNLRMRFTCTVYRAVAPEEVGSKCAVKKRKAIKKAGGEILMSQVDKEGWEALEGNGLNLLGDKDLTKKDKEIMCFTTRPVEQFEVLNDLVVDRGPSPYVSLLEVFGDEHHLTTVQADGLTVSTPTGSTAYSLSAGGSLVHPGIPALLITPICPHTLSFRPMLLPDSMELRICVPYNSRSTAWASFDGRGRVELKQGDHIKVTASKYPFPTVCADKQSTDWFNSISRTLRWNEREKQKSFVVIEEDGETSTRRAKKSSQGRPEDVAEGKESISAGDGLTKAQGELQDGGKEESDGSKSDDEEDEVDEEEEKYDIDDSTSNETADNSPTSPERHPRFTTKPSKSLESSKSGVDTPDRFATPYSAPPPMDRSLLLNALGQAELASRENEEGQRDDIHAQGSSLRASRPQIPKGRSPELRLDDAREEKTPKAASHHQPREPSRSKSSERGEPKAKAFAFYGMDDSGSDYSDRSE